MLQNEPPSSVCPVVPFQPLPTPNDMTTSVGAKRRPSRLDLEATTTTNVSSPRLYNKEVNEDSGETTFVNRNMSINEYSQAKLSMYKYADDISSLGTPSPLAIPKETVQKKSKWLSRMKSKKSMTWMDEMEKMGIKGGMLVTDNLNGAPIVRY